MFIKAHVQERHAVPEQQHTTHNNSNTLHTITLKQQHITHNNTRTATHYSQ